MRIWTIGHSTRSAEQFLSLLQEHGIAGLADVRTIPGSRRHPHFGGEVLKASLEGAEIRYRHFPALGGLRKPRADSANGAWKNPSFRGYADHMQTEEFSRALEALLVFGRERNVAVMCAEALWWQCHRMLISDALAVREIEVRHIMSQRGGSSAPPHRVTPFARVEQSQISYPGLL